MSDVVLYSLDILLAPEWFFHLGLPISDWLEVGKVITVFTFQFLALFSCSQIISLFPALHFSSQLYPHSYPQTLFKLAEMSRAFLGEKKKELNSVYRVISKKLSDKQSSP